MFHESECVLPDNYPVYSGFFYLIDGEILMSDVSGDVSQLKEYYQADEIRRCDLAERGLL